ncbi:MAG TPA: tol-pal system protein YbgF [Burkholderiales bacterium]|nr:tol-pal system protein YbgF [Burkholderiales bacterium]
MSARRSLSAAAAVLSCTLLVCAIQPVHAAEPDRELIAQAQPGDARSPGVIQLLNQVDTLQADINKLRGQFEVLNNALDNAQKRQRDMYLDLDTRLRRIEQQMGSAAQKNESAGAELDSRIKKLEQRSSAEENKGRDEQLSELETRIRKLEQQLAVPSGATAATVTAPAAAPSAATSTPAGPTPPAKPTPPTPPAAAAPALQEQNPVRRAYDNGLISYRSGDYQGAIVAFDGIVKRYPRDPLAPNAQYWVGDSWFNLRDFKSAAAAQQALISTYPDSPKVPDAMLILGSAYAAMGDNANARKTLEDLIARFPQSEAAEKGRQRLPKLK